MGDDPFSYHGEEEGAADFMEEARSKADRGGLAQEDNSLVRTNLFYDFYRMPEDSAELLPTRIYMQVSRALVHNK